MCAIFSLSTHLVTIFRTLGYMSISGCSYTYDLIDHELFMKEVTINGGEKDSDAIVARTSSYANWNTSTTLDRNLSKPAPIAGLHPTNQVPIIVREYRVFALAQRSESTTSLANQDNGKMAAPAPKEEASDSYCLFGVN